MTEMFFKYWFWPCLILGGAFGIWWSFFAPCNTVLKWSITLKNVPVRCINFTPAEHGYSRATAINL